MAKQSGLGDQLFVAGYDISGDVGAIGRISDRSGQLDVTAIDKSAHERIHSTRDGEIAFNAFFNDATLAGGATDQEHTVLAAKGSDADRVVSYFHGSAIGNVAAAMTAKQINYDPSRGADGSLTIDVQCLANATGLDYCTQLTAGKRTDTAATEGTSHNHGAASALGLAAYLQVFSVVGTSVTVKIEQSSDNGGSDAFAAAITFTAVNAGSVAAERKTTAALTTAVEQYLRVTTTGTFSSAVFAVCASRSLYVL